MPIAQLPLFGSYSQRGPLTAAIGAKDQRISGAIVGQVSNEAQKTATYYVQKRLGIQGAAHASAVVGTAVFNSPSTFKSISAYGATNSTIYIGLGVAVGPITGRAWHITETVINSVTFYLITSEDRTAWYVASDGKVSTFTFTGTTHTNTIVDGIASTTGLYSGMPISGTGIQAGTRILSVDSANQITLTLAATGSASPTLTSGGPAKIIDADFPTNISGPICEMDGYLFVMTIAGRIYNSDLNSVASWSASNFITANMLTDTGVGCLKYKNQIMGFGGLSIEMFFNGGNAAGSILSRTEQAFIPIGVVPGLNATTQYHTAKLLATQCGDKTFWVGAAPGDMVQIYVMEGFSPKKISTQIIDRLLSIAYITEFDSFKIFGMTFLYVGSNSTGVGDVTARLLYCVETNLWTESAFDAGYRFAGVYQTYNLGSTNVASILLAVSTTKTTGKLYFINSLYPSPETYQDDGVTFTMTIQLGPIDRGQDNIVYDKYIDLVADDEASGTATLEASNDDGQSYVTLGTFDMTKRKKRIWRCGSYRGGRMYRLTHAANAPFRGTFLRVNYEVGAS